MSSLLRQEILNYVNLQYGTLPDYPWPKYPKYAVLRHGHNRKWYGVIMDIPKNRFGIKSDEIVDVLNVKCDPIVIDSIVEEDGIFPAYHMSKGSWVSVLLDGSVNVEFVRMLINRSYELTFGVAKKKKGEL